MHFFYWVACKVVYFWRRNACRIVHTIYLLFQCIPLPFRLKCVCFHGAAMPRARSHTRSRSPSPDDYPSHFEQIRRWRLHGNLRIYFSNIYLYRNIQKCISLWRHLDSCYGKRHRQLTEAATFLHDYFATFSSCFGAQGLVTWVGWVAQKAASLVIP